MLAPALSRIARFRRDDKATLSVEAVILVPFVLWLVLGLFTITDAFRAIHSYTMSTYTLGDILSRETGFVTPADIEGLNDLHQLVSRSSDETTMRATMIVYGNLTGYDVQWSYATGEKAAITKATFGEISERVPGLQNGDAVILVETWGPYFPIVDFMVSPFEMYQAVATRPRFGPTIAWQGS